MMQNNGGISRIMGLRMDLLYYIVMVFFVTSSGFIFAKNAGVYSNIVLVYLCLVVASRVLAKKKTFSRESVFDNLLVFIVATVFVFWVASAFKLSVTPGIDAPQFSSFWFSPLYFIFVIGVSETYIFASGQSALAEIGPVWKSVAFSVVHLGTFLAVLAASLVTPSLAVLLSLFIFAFIANLVYIAIYTYTGSVYLTALVHGVYDMERYGVLAVMFSGAVR